ncbi:MAG: type IV secretory system conjugative DNA transfer family protein [Phenylobacterium sp.]|nr:type IV secretory system conjugative DNA transfer family protein [Phenylobacterium sp.]
MKTSLEHLPDAKRNELAQVLEVLFREFEEATKRKSSKRGQGRILKVILFGSYARGDWVDDPVGGYGVNNTILDNCHVFTAFAAQDPLTQDKVSRLTGTIAELRMTRSHPAAFASGHGSVSRSEIERPLLEPGEIRALPDDEQLVFAAGHRPLRCRKVRYDQRSPFRERAAISAPDAGVLDTPGRPAHPWAGRRALGENRTASLPLFKEAVGAMDEKKAAAKAAQIYGRVAEEFAAQEAILDQLQEHRHGKSG